MKFDFGDMLSLAFLVFIATALCFLTIGFQAGTYTERSEWVAGRRRVVEEHCGQPSCKNIIEIWHAPLKPGDTGWWEKP